MRMYAAESPIGGRLGIETARTPTEEQVRRLAKSYRPNDGNLSFSTAGFSQELQAFIAALATVALGCWASFL